MKLSEMRCYLCGPIDDCKNYGTEWRDWVRPQLQKMGVIVFDPTQKIILPENADTIPVRRQLKQEGRWEELRQMLKPIRNMDLRMVDKSDFLVAYLDLDLVMCGTYNEIFLADSQKKPILLVCKQGKAAIPDWLFATVHHNYMFNSFEEMFIYLDKLNRGEDVFVDRWWFIKE